MRSSGVCDAVPLAEGEDLAGDDVEEGQAVAHGRADFGPRMPMLVPSPPLSLMTTVRASASRDRGLVGPDLVEVRHVAQRLDGVLGDGPGRRATASWSW